MQKYSMHNAITKIFLCIFAILLIPHNDAQAAELLSNNSFETPVAPNNGNNFFTTIPNWTLINLSTNRASPHNIVRPFAGYTGGPTVTPPGGGSQYYDIVSSSGTLVQNITVPSNGIITISAYYSVRDFQRAISGNMIRLRNSSGVVVASASVNFLASDPFGIWKQAISSPISVPAGNYRFEAFVDDAANIDLASANFQLPPTVVKSSSILSDTISLANPKAIPSSIVNYRIDMANPAAHSISNNSIVIIDRTPDNVDLLVNAPLFVFIGNSSNLTLTFSGLSSTSDDVDFSNNNQSTWTYIPTPNASGADPAVTHIRLRPKGSMAAGSNFSVFLRYLVN